MFRKLRPGRFCGPAKGKTDTGSGDSSSRDQAPPPRLELPRRGAAASMYAPQKSGAPRPPHLKSVGPAGETGRAAIPSDPRAPARVVSRPVAQPIEQPARPAIPPYPVSGARGAAAASAALAQGPLASPSPARAAEVQSFGRLMLVGPQIRLSGEIKACERLVVEGIVEGEVSDTERLEVARGGRFQGTAQIESCAVDGVFEGELDVRGVLTLKANGRVAGKVRYGEIEIERGGVIAGDFSTRGAAEVSGQAAAAQSGRSHAGRSAKPAGPRPA
jgi:cytoskeletal protein CcmA (bactofilin family)